MAWGEHEEFFRFVQEQTGEAPKALREKPVVRPDLAPIWNAFWALSGDRQVGGMGGVSAIPFMSIDRYAARYGINAIESFDRFHHLLRRLDAAFVAKTRPPPGSGDGGT